MSSDCPGRVRAGRKAGRLSRGAKLCSPQWDRVGGRGWPLPPSGPPPGPPQGRAGCFLFLLAGPELVVVTWWLWQCLPGPVLSLGEPLQLCHAATSATPMGAWGWWPTHSTKNVQGRPLACHSSLQLCPSPFWSVTGHLPLVEGHATKQGAQVVHQHCLLLFSLLFSCSFLSPWRKVGTERLCYLPMVTQLGREGCRSKT